AKSAFAVRKICHPLSEAANPPECTCEGVAIGRGRDRVFEPMMQITHPSFDLNPHIPIPLTSAITRSVHENINTSLFVDVRWGDHVLHCDTKPAASAGGSMAAHNTQHS